MYLIAGLGNPGARYINTRHNIGFLVVDEIIKKSSSPITLNNSIFHGNTFKIKDNIIVKPLTYMNLSGKSISAIANYYKIFNENIIIIHDDLDLPFGTIKFKKDGGSGGHNGLKSIDSYIGSDYLRVRIGIGRPKDRVISDYVLENFNNEELDKLEDIISHVIKSVEMIEYESFEKISSLMTKKVLG